MWISRKEYNFLKENAEKNINAECEILKVKESQKQAVARAMEEYSATLEELDKLKKCHIDNYNEYYRTLKAIKCICKALNMFLTETIKTENGEESTVSKFKSIEALAEYMKCYNDHTLNYIKEKLEAIDK